MTNIILVIILVGILGGAVSYIVKSKKKGNKCIGCPYGKMCQNKNDNNSPCNYQGNTI